MGSMPASGEIGAERSVPTGRLVARFPEPVGLARWHHPPQRSRAYRLTDSPDLASQPSVRGIGIHSGVPDHQVLESGYLSWRL